MKIAFWEPMHGCCSTANLMAVMLAIANESGRSILITQTHYDLNDLEGPMTGGLEGAGRADFFFNTGLDAAIKFFKSGMLTGETVDSCAIRINEKISLLAGTRQNSRAAYDSNIVGRMIGHILDVSEEYYDMVAVDTNAGFAGVSGSVLEKADVVVVNLRQNLRMIDNLFKSVEFAKIDPAKVFYLFGSYDPDSKYNLNNLRHIYSNIKNSNSSGLPHSTGYLDALCDKRTVRFITSGLSEKENADRKFFAELTNTGQKLTDMIKKAGDGSWT